MDRSRSEHAADHQLECSFSCVCVTVVPHPLGIAMVARACHIVSKAGLFVIYIFNIINLF